MGNWNCSRARKRKEGLPWLPALGRNIATLLFKEMRMV